MRGLIAFALVIAAVVPLAAFAAVQEKAASNLAEAELRALLLENRHYAELELKESLAQALRSARGNSREEIAEDAAAKLAKWEAFEEAEFASRGIRLDLWCGVAGEQELSSLKTRIFEERAPLKPALARDLSSYVIGWRGRPLPAAVAFVDARPGGGAELSRNGLSFAPEISAALSRLAGEAGCGASIYFPEGEASVAFAGEGFG